MQIVRNLLRKLDWHLATPAAITFLVVLFLLLSGCTHVQEPQIASCYAVCEQNGGMKRLETSGLSNWVKCVCGNGLKAEALSYGQAGQPSHFGQSQ